VDNRFFREASGLRINIVLGEGRERTETKTVVKFLAELTEADSRRRGATEPRERWIPVNFSDLWTAIRWNIDIIHVPFANQVLREDRCNFPTPRTAPLLNHFRDTFYPKDVFLRFLSRADVPWDPYESVCDLICQLRIPNAAGRALGFAGEGFNPYGTFVVKGCC